jgi:hypothetical protein
MSSHIRNTLNAGIAALTISAAVIALAPTPAAAIDFGGHRSGNFCHTGLVHAGVGNSGPTVLNTAASWFAE